MQKHGPLPIKTQMYDKNGNMAPVWFKWFEDIGRSFDDYRRNPDIVSATNLTLKTNDYGKVIRFDNGASDVICTLMVAGSGDLNCWLTIFRLGTGRLTIIPDANAHIEVGSKGGKLWCDEPRRAAANVTLQLITPTLWAITGSTGIWKVA